MVSIPQAVSTVATMTLLCSVVDKLTEVSIPQAVSTVATLYLSSIMKTVLKSFNTASGKYCCNILLLKKNLTNFLVSIPQAVSTVATKIIKNHWEKYQHLFQYRKR